MGDQNKRLVFLRVVVKLMALVAMFFFLRVLFGSIPERESANEVKVARYNVAQMQPGDHRLVEWNNKPLFILYRKPEWESLLASADYNLYRDPESKKSVQPDVAKNTVRSHRAGWFVTLGLGTGSGCTLIFTPPVDPVSGNGSSDGVFIDGCDKSRYDLAGRVYSGQGGTRNTVVPRWQLKGDEILVSGG